MNRTHGTADFLGRGHGLFRQFADFIGNNRKSSSGITCTSRFNGRVQCKKVGLVRNVGNDVHDLSDTFGLLTEFIQTVLHALGFFLYAVDGTDDLLHNPPAFNGRIPGLVGIFAALDAFWATSSTLAFISSMAVAASEVRSC